MGFSTSPLPPPHVWHLAGAEGDLPGEDGQGASPARSSSRSTPRGLPAMAPLQGQGIPGDQGSWQAGPGTCTQAHPEPSPDCQGCHAVSVGGGMPVPTEGKWRAVGCWPALWRLSSDILASLVVFILERAERGVSTQGSLPSMGGEPWTGKPVTWLSVLLCLSWPLFCGSPGTCYLGDSNTHPQLGS